MTRLKRVALMRAGGTPTVDDPSLWSETGLPWVAIGDMTRSPVVDHTDRAVSDSGRESKSLPVGQPGTVLFAMYASVGALAVLGVEATWNQAILGLEPRPGMSEGRFLRYWLEHLRPDLGALTRSNTQDNLNAEQVGNLPFPVSGVSHQSHIADYLDAETARIDALIVKKRQMIELLTERHMDVITEGVRGTFTSAATEPSHLNWLDRRGSGWDEVKLTLVARLGSGHTPSRDHPEWWLDCTVPWITTGEVAQMRSDRIEFITETREMISDAGIANSSAEIHPAGTVVLCRTASAGYSAIMGRDMATSQDFATWTCGALLQPRFLLLCLRAMRQDLLGRLAMGSTHQTIYMPDIESLRGPIPTIGEQDRIVEEVWRRLRVIESAVDALVAQIALLTEHRQALITVAVTGSLRIPGVAA